MGLLKLLSEISKLGLIAKSYDRIEFAINEDLSTVKCSDFFQQ